MSESKWKWTAADVRCTYYECRGTPPIAGLPIGFWDAFAAALKAKAVSYTHLRAHET